MKLHQLIVWGCLCFALLAVPAAAQIGTGTVSVTVTDDGGIPLAGVTVQAKTAKGAQGAVTDFQGVAQISGLDPAETYSVLSDLSGYASSETISVKVSNGGTTFVGVVLEPCQTGTASLFGTQSGSALQTETCSGRVCNGGSAQCQNGTTLNCPTSGGPTCSQEETCTCLCKRGPNGTYFAHNACVNIGTSISN